MEGAVYMLVKDQEKIKHHHDKDLINSYIDLLYIKKFFHNN